MDVLIIYYFVTIYNCRDEDIFSGKYSANSDKAQGCRAFLETIIKTVA